MLPLRYCAVLCDAMTRDRRREEKRT